MVSVSVEAYQTLSRKQGTDEKIELVKKNINSNAKTIIDVGSQQGVVSTALAEKGYSVTGYEADYGSCLYAEYIVKDKMLPLVFHNKYVDSKLIDSFPDTDVILFFSVHHQIVKAKGLEEANNLLLKLFAKSKLQLFFEPCVIYEKHGQKMPFAENDFDSALAYFTSLFKDFDCKAEYIGSCLNMLPPDRKSVV